MPGPPFDQTLPVYAITDNILLVDATGGQLLVNSQQSAAMSSGSGVYDAAESLATAVVNLINRVQTQTSTAARMQAMDDSGPIPAGFTNNGSGSSIGNITGAGGTPIDTNSLWLQITNDVAGVAYLGPV